MLTLTALILGGVAGFFGGWIVRKKKVKLLTSPKSPESRVHSYLFLLEHDADAWTMRNKQYTGWVYLTHPTGMEVRIYKKDGDVETDIYNRAALSDREKQALRVAVSKSQNQKAITGILN